MAQDVANAIDRFFTEPALSYSRRVQDGTMDSLIS
jgi:hypothetical protein